jgi:hypothetical protein
MIEKDTLRMTSVSFTFFSEWMSICRPSHVKGTFKRVSLDDKKMKRVFQIAQDAVMAD